LAQDIVAQEKQRFAITDPRTSVIGERNGSGNESGWP